MIKYLLLLSLLTAPFAQQAEAVVTHYDLDGNLIEGDVSSGLSSDLDSMEMQDSMNMVDVPPQEQVQESITTSDVSNIENIESVNEQSISETVESQIVDSAVMSSEDSMSPMMEADQNITEQPVSNMDIQSPEDPNMAIESSLMASPEIENGFIQGQLNNEDEHGGDDQGDHTGEEHHEGEHQEGEHQEGEYQEGEHQEGEHQEGEHHEGDHQEGDHQELSAENTDHGFIQSAYSDSNSSEEEHEGGHDGEHHEGEHHDNEHHEEQHHEGDHHGEDHPEGHQIDANDLFMSPDLEHGFVQSSVTNEGDDEQGGGHAEEHHSEEQNQEEQHEGGHQDGEEHQNQQEADHQEPQENSEHFEGQNNEEENHDSQQNGEGENQNNEQLQQSEQKPALVQGDCIIIYSQCNFKGEALEACNSLSEIENFKADIKSIYIPKGLGLTVYDGENFTGKTHKFKSSQECLAKPLSLAQLTTKVLTGQNLRANQ